MMSDLRVLFMGTPDFALPTCEALLQRKMLIGVVTQPDRPKGRGGRMAAPPVKEFALAHGLPLAQPERLKDEALLPFLNDIRPDLIVVAAYGKILPEYILNFPRFGCINIHGSLLPKYRGAAPIQRAVMNGERETGVTIMRMARGMDTGDMILQAATPISEADTAGSVFERLSLMGADLLLSAIEQLKNGTAVFTPQNEVEATYAPMIEKSEGLLDFHQSAEQVRSMIMGLSPAPGAYIELPGYRLKVAEAARGEKTAAEPGIVTAIGKSGIRVACGNGYSVTLKTVQKQGKNRMDAYAYACGAKLTVGEFIR